MGGAPVPPSRPGLPLKQNYKFCNCWFAKTCNKCFVSGRLEFRRVLTGASTSAGKCIFLESRELKHICSDVSNQVTFTKIQKFKTCFGVIQILRARIALI